MKVTQVVARPFFFLARGDAWPLSVETHILVQIHKHHRFPRIYAGPTFVDTRPKQQAVIAAQAAKLQIPIGKPPLLTFTTKTLRVSDDF